MSRVAGRVCDQLHLARAFAFSPSNVECIAPSDPGGGWDFTDPLGPQAWPIMLAILFLRRPQLVAAGCDQPVTAPFDALDTWRAYFASTPRV